MGNNSDRRFSEEDLDCLCERFESRDESDAVLGKAARIAIPALIDHIRELRLTLTVTKSFPVVQQPETVSETCLYCKYYSGDFSIDKEACPCGDKCGSCSEFESFDSKEGK
jgi:hypothetical protein